MNEKKAKTLRLYAREQTVGGSVSNFRELYRLLKKKCRQHKIEVPNLKLYRQRGLEMEVFGNKMGDILKEVGK